MACELVLTDTVARTDEAYRKNGNVLLDDLFDATIHRRPADVDALMVPQERATELRAVGRSPCVVGSGVSSPVGCLGYAACAAEIVAQERDLGFTFSRIAVPNGSSGTYAGLTAGLKVLGDEPSRVISFSILAPLARVSETTRRITAETLALLDPV